MNTIRFSEKVLPKNQPARNEKIERIKIHGHQYLVSRRKTLKGNPKRRKGEIAIIINING